MLILTFVFSIIGPGDAYAAPSWYDASWLYRKKITILGSQVTGTLTNFPVLISVPADVDLAADARPDGWDILFTDTTQLKLPYEREQYVSASGKLVAWVKIPSLTHNVDTTVFMYYGNPTVANDQQNAVNVWDTNYKMVQHLEETVSGAGSIKDSTGYHNDGTPTNIAAGNLGVAGKADGATSFDPTAPPDYINCGNAASLDVTGKITVEAWIYPTVANLNKGIVAKTQGAAPQYRLFIVSPGGQVKFQVWDSNIGDWISATGGVPTLNNWHQVVGVCDNSNIIIYLDGVATVGDPYSGSIDSTLSNVTIGIHASIVTGNAFQGTIDEARISDADRNPDWISTSYSNQNNPSAFFSLGPGPQVQPVVGGRVFSVNKAAILAPWIILGSALLIISIRVIIYLRKKSSSRPPIGKNP